MTGRRNPTKSGRKRSRDFAYFDPSKSVAEGRKGALNRKQTSLTFAEPQCDAERHKEDAERPELHATRSVSR
ncbi:hypothetical protein BKM03_20190 [Pseudomonas avellanae]|uniref:Uncharacterized protein n=1 Tax=Pseudomonas avellanae TaxID=46257 RepID=A0AAD0E060_9PSED|nr:hypothetical protein BKM03_20190 [Pseudomonas avellanae]